MEKSIISTFNTVRVVPVINVPKDGPEDFLNWSIEFVNIVCRVKKKI